MHDLPEPAPAAPLLDQLRALRKGAGLLAPDLQRRLGPDLVRLCGLEPLDDPVTVRSKIGTTVTGLLAHARVPAEVRTAVLVALGLHRDAAYGTLTARRDSLAQAVPCDVRTVRRQEDRGFVLLAAAAGATLRDVPPRPRPDWFVQEFRAVLRLDTPRPELLEERTLVAARSGLTEIVASLSLPRTEGAPVEVEAVYGVRLVRQEELTASHARFVLALPRPLEAGETHEYGLVFRVPADHLPAPHYAFVPLRPCQRFDLAVRFDPDRLPAAVWRVDGAPPRVLDSDRPTDRPVQPDPFGEVRVRFDFLLQGLGYGLGWTPPPPPQRDR